MNYKNYIAISTALIVFSTCRIGSKQTKVIIYTKAPVNIMLTINQVPYFDEKVKVIDSAKIINNHDSLILYVPRQQERLYDIDVEGQHMPITFINDAPLIRVHVDYFANTFNIAGSNATNSLYNFEGTQMLVSNKLKELAAKIYSSKTNKANKKMIDSLQHVFRSDLSMFFKRYINYADTVKSAAAFIKVYNTIDFETDYKTEKQFILHTQKRFSNDKPIQRLCKEALATVTIYEQEYLIGNTLPYIKLPDQNGKEFSTAILKNTYYLIDFWTTYCSECLVFKEAEKKLLSSKVTINNLQIISVAIDDEKDNWKTIINKNGYNWPQLIDTKMWQGTTAQTLKFDSIPFNFLIDRSGKIIDKAIKPEDLSKVIATRCKK